MLAKQKLQKSVAASLWMAAWTLLLLVLAPAAAPAQTDPKKVEAPLFQEYKGVKIGMTAAEVRAKLGKAQSDDKDGLMYVFPDDVTAQYLTDAAQKVRTISVMYGSDCPKQPKFEEVFGTAVPAEPQEDGTIFKLMRYPTSGFWVSYNRAGGEKPTVTVVMQKLP